MNQWTIINCYVILWLFVVVSCRFLGGFGAVQCFFFYLLSLSKSGKRKKVEKKRGEKKERPPNQLKYDTTVLFSSKSIFNLWEWVACGRTVLDTKVATAEIQSTQEKYQKRKAIWYKKKWIPPLIVWSFVQKHSKFVEDFPCVEGWEKQFYPF